ncbi:MAG TPA: DUF2630 family protein [Ktedonobacteraceae bacterium]|nr:DUF2630 family protein [Ktedonobacteraceae bacterium]
MDDRYVFLDDSDVLSHVQKLVNEERELRRLDEKGGLTDEQRVTMRQLGIYLDQCWDLLRQRRARRKAGLDPADARLRGANDREVFPQ